MCEWKEFCEYGDKGDDCADPDFQNGCEQYWGFSRMDDDRFRREMTGRREAGKIAQKRFAESVKELVKQLRHELQTYADSAIGHPPTWSLASLTTIEGLIDNTLNDGGNQQ